VGWTWVDFKDKQCTLGCNKMWNLILPGSLSSTHLQGAIPWIEVLYLGCPNLLGCPRIGGLPGETLLSLMV